MSSEENIGDEENNEEEGNELVMLFVTVVSKGGPHEDNSYAAGYEMGTFDAMLKYAQPAVHSQNIHADNQPQADLIAMEHGYKAEFRVTIEEEWTWMTVWKIT